MESKLYIARCVNGWRVEREINAIDHYEYTAESCIFDTEIEAISHLEWLNNKQGE